ncbi:hypothetical protein FWC31_01690 [Candidatus Saccharibacteria bacterium]|nr:hypothetical protein [Candidatus Saccharibacteria bacterium]
MDLVLSGGSLGGKVSTVDYIDDNVSYLTALALGHALPTALHDKRALSPALRDQLTKQIEAAQAGSALMVTPAPD